MAKKKSKSTPQQGQRKAGRPAFSSSSVRINTFNKGMNKDIAQSLELNTQWWHARNAANYDADGDVGLIGNEPANLQCGVIPYTVIGAIHRYGDEWIIYSTDDISSEIGRFDDSECKYETIVNAPCLNFKKKHLITGAAKENFDCTWQVYWDDGLNPSRTLNIDDVPYIQEIVSAPGDPCIVYEDKEPKVLDCEKIRLAPLVSTPCLKLTKARDGGLLSDGCYQAFIAYVENEQRVTDYIGISNLQTLWNHNDDACGLNLDISELDKDYEFFQLTLLIRNQGQLFRKIIGLYSTEVTSIDIDFIDPTLASETAVDLFFISPSYEKSDSMFVVNDYLIRQGPTEQFDFNYQPIANDIVTSFVVNQVPIDYYYKAGNKLGFMRDEQYAFFIRWIYNTGERSASYHIPGRAPKPYTLPNGTTFNEDEKIVSSNSVNVLGDEEYVFQVYNTGQVTQAVSEEQEDGSFIVARGEMGYWQSTERYPSNRPDIWGDLCGEFIRHHKIPSEQQGGSDLALTSINEDFINIVGVEFSNIARPIDNDGNVIENIVGYEILKGSRMAAKSILAKGMFKNMREYTVPAADNLLGNDIQGLYVNYPYNDLRPDPYFTTSRDTEGCDDYADSISNFPPLTGYRTDVFSFHSPDLMFTKPFLNTSEAKIYGEIHGSSSGKFIPSENHPGQKLLRNISAVISAFIGLGYAVRQIQGTPNVTALPVQAMNNAYPEWHLKFKDIGGGGGNFVAVNAAGTLTGNFSANSGGGTDNSGDNNTNNQKGDNPAPDSVVDTAYTGAGQNIKAYYDSLDSSSGSSGFPWSNISWSSIRDYLQNLVSGAWDDLTEIIDPGNELDERLNDLAIENINLARQYGEGFTGGGANQGVVKDSPESNMPKTLKRFMKFMLLQKNIAVGGQEVIDLMYNLTSFQQHALKYNSHGLYNQFIEKDIADRFRSNIRSSNYIGSSFQTFDDNEFKINNLYRPDTVAVSISNDFSEPITVDNSRFVLGGTSNPNSSLLRPEGPFGRNISALYGALKFNIDNQYGQLDGIKQLQMRGCVEKLDPENPPEFLYTSKPIFSGDVFISRYTEKCIMPIFTDFLMGQYDGFPYDYKLRVNIPYPRFWMDTRKFDIGQLAQAVSTLGISTLLPGSADSLVPNDLFYLDRGVGNCGFANSFANVFIGDDLNATFAMVHAYMYTHVNGINDFYVETEINLPYRDYEEPVERRFYDIYKYNDIDQMFHAEIQSFDNFYKYDESLTPTKFSSQLTTFGRIQPRDYDPLVADTCFTKYPKRLIYSLQADQEDKRDYWRQFLPYNYKDFKGEVSVIKPFDKTGALVFFPYLSPQLFQGIEQIKTLTDAKLTIGDGSLFSQPMQNVVNADLSNEYGSCESLRSVMNTPAGLFFISQAQGKIFQFVKGKGITPISNLGMKYWFNEYLPSTLIKQYPALEESPLGDNPVAGVGCQTIYDATDDIVYFMKKDYRVRKEHIANITYDEDQGFLLNKNIQITLGDPIYFEDCSWTVSYDPKSKAWISFHDWHPELSLPSINHFFTTKTVETTIPQCPPGFNFNPVTGLCEQGTNFDAPSNVSVQEVIANITGGPVGCKLDIVIAMDVSGSTTNSPPGVNNPALNPGVQTLIAPSYVPFQLNPSGQVIPGSNSLPGGQILTPGGQVSNSGLLTAAGAQLAWVDTFMNDPGIRVPMAAGDFQVGFTKWSGATNQGGTQSLHLLSPGGLSMSNTITGAQAVNLFYPGDNNQTEANNVMNNWIAGTGGNTHTDAAIGANNPFGTASPPNINDGGLALLNDKTRSSLAAQYPGRAQDPNFRQILIVVSDGTGAQQTPGSGLIATMQTPNVNPGVTTNNTGSWAAGQAFLGNRNTAQEIYAVFVGAGTALPNGGQAGGSSVAVNSITNTVWTNNGASLPPGGNQFGCNANDQTSMQAVATQVAGSVCGVPYTGTCPAGYTMVFHDANTGYWNSLTSATDSVDAAMQAGFTPRCRKVECGCDPGGTLTGVGDCPDTPPLIYQVGPSADPTFVNPNPALCNYNTFIEVQPNYDVGSFWRHNDRCDLYANFYGKSYPWEIDLISNTGQAVNTVRSIEYQLETYVHKGEMDYACGGDAWEDLNYNFDQAIIYNNEQVSGLLLLNMAPFNDPGGQLNYPIINPTSIDVLSAKVEHKFRLNQFWDITNDRGEFTNAEQPIWNTECNGYIRNLNTVNLNYNKPEVQRKKFRHYSNHVLLRRQKSDNRKMLLRLNNTKLNLSMR